MVFKASILFWCSFLMTVFFLSISFWNLIAAGHLLYAAPWSFDPQFAHFVALMLQH